MKEQIRAEFIISGKVQGVGFRYFVYNHAINFNVSGYAKNLWDGTVEVVAEGTEEAINLLHEQLKTGPTLSRVKNCSKRNGIYTGEFIGFRIQ